MAIAWKGGHAVTPNSWADPLNWIGSIAPADGDDVIIAAGATEPSITVNTPASLNSLTVNAGANLTVRAFTFDARSVTNAGTITGSTVSGNAFGVQMFGAADTVTNSGTITGDVNGAGVLLHEGGLITNSLSGVIKGGKDGILSRGAPGTFATVINDGTIQSTGVAGTGVLFSDSAGIVNDTLTNSGTILGQTAVQFGAGNDLLKLAPGASFSGLVDGGAGTNTLELTAGTGAGRLTGIGTNFTHFGTLLVDTSAQWAVAGISNGGLGTIALTGLTSLDTIDLTDFAFTAVSGVFANNALVLTNAIGQDTLHIQGNFSAGDFRFSSDGSGGTNIRLAPTPTTTPTPTPTPPPTPTAAHFDIIDTSTSATLPDTSTPYPGPVADIQFQFITTTADSLAITARTPNSFIHTGSGTDAIDVSKVNGTNVLDGSTGSNFLVGGSGFDTFFVDDRSPAADVFSTVVGFHSGDNATIFGVTPTDFKLNTLDDQGAAGFKGLDFGFSAAGKANANLVLTGFTTTDLTNGRLTTTFGTNPATAGAPASTFMLIHAN